jgi:hypothetical protein
MGRAKGRGRQLTKPESPSKEQQAEEIEAVFEERGMPEKEAQERARNAAKRIRTSKQTGQRLEAKPKRASKNAGRARPSSANPESPEQTVEDLTKKPSSQNDYSPAAPYRRKSSKGGGSTKGGA